jgi:hypothetical protein
VEGGGTFDGLHSFLLFSFHILPIYDGSDTVCYIPFDADTWDTLLIPGGWRGGGWRPAFVLSTTCSLPGRRRLAFFGGGPYVDWPVCLCSVGVVRTTVPHFHFTGDGPCRALLAVLFWFPVDTGRWYLRSTTFVIGIVTSLRMIHYGTASLSGYEVITVVHYDSLLLVTRLSPWYGCVGGRTLQFVLRWWLWLEAHLLLVTLAVLHCLYLSSLCSVCWFQCYILPRWALCLFCCSACMLEICSGILKADMFRLLLHYICSIPVILLWLLFVDSQSILYVMEGSICSSAVTLEWKWLMVRLLEEGLLHLHTDSLISADIPTSLRDLHCWLIHLYGGPIVEEAGYYRMQCSDDGTGSHLVVVILPHSDWWYMSQCWWRPRPDIRFLLRSYILMDRFIGRWFPVLFRWLSDQYYNPWHFLFCFWPLFFRVGIWDSVPTVLVFLSRWDVRRVAVPLGRPLGIVFSACIHSHSRGGRWLDERLQRPWTPDGPITIRSCLLLTLCSGSVCCFRETVFPGVVTYIWRFDWSGLVFVLWWIRCWNAIKLFVVLFNWMVVHFYVDSTGWNCIEAFARYVVLKVGWPRLPLRLPISLFSGRGDSVAVTRAVTFTRKSWNAMTKFRTIRLCLSDDPTVRWCSGEGSYGSLHCWLHDDTTHSMCTCSDYHGCLLLHFISVILGGLFLRTFPTISVLGTRAVLTFWLSSAVYELFRWWSGVSIQTFISLLHCLHGCGHTLPVRVVGDHLRFVVCCCYLTLCSCHFWLPRDLTHSLLLGCSVLSWRMQWPFYFSNYGHCAVHLKFTEDWSCLGHFDLSSIQYGWFAHRLSFAFCSNLQSFIYTHVVFCLRLTFLEVGQHSVHSFIWYHAVTPVEGGARHSVLCRGRPRRLGVPVDGVMR